MSDASRTCFAQLTLLLQRFSPSEGERRAYVQSMALLAAADPAGQETAGSADARNVLASDHYVPGHFTASAFVTDPSLEQVLLIHHGKLDIWVQPGGHVEPGDASVLEAAVRETTEETGVGGLAPHSDELFDIDVHPIPVRGDAPAHRHYDLRFHLVTGLTDVHLTEEVKGVRWAALDDVPLFTTDASVLRPVEKLRRLATSSF